MTDRVLVSSLQLIRQESECGFDIDSSVYGLALSGSKQAKDPAKSNEANFVMIDDQVEKVDLNFFKGKHQSLVTDEVAALVEKEYNKLSINETEVLNFFNKILFSGSSNIELKKPAKL